MASKSSDFYDALEEEPPKLYTPLHIAARNGQLNKVKVILQLDDINVNNAENAHGMTPLHLAAENGHLNIVKALLKQPGIDMTKKEKYGRTAIDLANNQDHTDVVTAIQVEELANKKYKQGKLKQRMLSFAQTHRDSKTHSDSKVGGRRKSRRAIKSKRKRQTKRRRR